MRVKFLVASLFLMSLLVSCKGGSVTPVPTSTPDNSFTAADLSWLKAHAISFDTSDPSASLEDLTPLKSMVGDARIVALGEATLGTHEFSQMKHRMLEYLVENMGFNTFAMAIGFPEADRLDAYLHTGLGDPAELIKGLFFSDTQEVLELIEWMRAYNADPAHTRQISFYGFQTGSDQLARQYVIEFVQQVDSPAAAQIQNGYSCYLVNDACMKMLQDVFDLLNGHRTDYIAKSSPAAFEKALHYTRLVIQNAAYSSKNDPHLLAQYLAENVEWIVDQSGPNGKVVLWAHNGVVMRFSDGAGRSVGDYLHLHYGDQMLVFGFLFYRGSFHALGVGSQNVIQTFHAAEPLDGSYEFFFQAAGLPRFFLDMRSARPGSSGQAWLFTPHSSYQVGSMYNPYNPYTFTAPLARLFDVVIYFKDTSPSILLDQ